MNNIKCPHCGTEFDATASIQEHLRKELELEYQKKLDGHFAEQRKLSDALQKDRDAFEAKKRQENEIFKNNLDKAVIEERAKLKEILDRENDLVLNNLQHELNAKSKEVSELKGLKAELERAKREKLELRTQIELENEEKLSNDRKRIQDEATRQAEERFVLSVREKDQQLEAQKKLVEEMQRKIEQGSMQLQGEVQELAIEEWLKVNFPLDEILEVKKGIRGADCTQVVNDRARMNCGRIYYESKRTQAFAIEWIEKLKTDMRSQAPGIGVIVTQVMPKGMERMGLKDGIWICTFEEFKSLSFILRTNVIRVSEALASQENKGDKMTLLYDYMTGPQFRAQIEAIVEAFVSMKDDLDKEKRAVMSTWEKRNMKIEKVLTSTTAMYGTIQGIGGASIGEVKELELTQ